MTASIPNPWNKPLTKARHWSQIAKGVVHAPRHARGLASSAGVS
jgi:hypothetical protein